VLKQIRRQASGVTLVAKSDRRLQELLQPTVRPMRRTPAITILFEILRRLSVRRYLPNEARKRCRCESCEWRSQRKLRTRWRMRCGRRSQRRRHHRPTPTYSVCRGALPSPKESLCSAAPACSALVLCKHLKQSTGAGSLRLILG